MVMNGYDTDGDGGNNFYTVNGRTFYYARYPIRVKRSELVRLYLVNLTEFDLINSFHLHADFFRYYPTGLDRPVRVHGHGDAVPGAARHPRDRVLPHRHVHVPRPPVRVHRARLDGLLRRRRLMEAGTAPRSGLAWRLWALAPILLLALVVGAFVSGGDSLVDLIGRNPPRGGRVRHPPRRVPARRDPDPGPQPAARGADDRLGHGRRRDRPVHARRARDAEAPPLEHDRRPLRLGRGRPDLRRRHELDRDRDGEGDPGGRRDADRLGARVPRLRGDRASSSASSRSRSACSGCPRCAAPTRAGSPRSWR